MIFGYIEEYLLRIFCSLSFTFYLLSSLDAIWARIIRFLLCSISIFPACPINTITPSSSVVWPVSLVCLSVCSQTAYSQCYDSQLQRVDTPNMSCVCIIFSLPPFFPSTPLIDIELQCSFFHHVWSQYYYIDRSGWLPLDQKRNILSGHVFYLLVKLIL